MLDQDEIRQALHASRSVPLGVANPHGPLGLEHLAAAVVQVIVGPGASQKDRRVRRTVELTDATWEKLTQLAKQTTEKTAQSVTASQVAAAILEQFVTDQPS